MKNITAAAALLLLPTVLAAQVDTAPIKALILPMMAEVTPGAAAEVFTDCIIGQSTEAELAAFAAASGPSTEVGALISTVLARPETLACASAAAE